MTEMTAVPLHHDGADLVGALALPDRPGPHPGVLVVHTAHGLTETMRGHARRLADLGYAALAVDMYGGGEPAPNSEAAGVAFTDLLGVPGRVRARTVAWHDALKSLPDVDPERTAALGYCFGGLCVLELARSGADARAVVSFHGTLTTAEPARPGTVRAHVAIYAGGQDPYAPRDDIDSLEQELTAAGADYSLTIFSRAAHGFTDPHAGDMGRPGIAYEPLAAAQSWAGTVALLESVLTS